MPSPVPPKIKQRLRVQTLLALDWSTSMIAADVGCTQRTAQRWKARFISGGNEQDQAHTGRKRKLSPAMERQIVQHVALKRKRSLRKTSAWLRRKGVDASKDTIARTLVRRELKAFHRPRQQQITATQKRKRVAFARMYRDHDWTNTLMTDETEFALVRASNSRNDVVWAHTRDEVPPREIDKYSPSLRFWAGASSRGRTSLHFYSGNLTAAKYQSILAEALPEITAIFGHHHWTFQHDGATCHSARATNLWLDD